jgi:hypothetical protein
VGNGNGVSRGDRNRNARLARLRVRVMVENAIIVIDLADIKQTVVMCDHDSKVLAGQTFRCRAWDPCRSGLRLRALHCEGVLRCDGRL